MAKEINKKKKFQLAIALITLISFLGVTTFIIVLQYTKNELLTLFGERSFVLATFTMTEIDRSIIDNINRVEILSKRLSVEEILLESNEQFEQIPDRETQILTDDEQWQQLETNETNPLLENLLNNQLSTQLRSEFNTPIFSTSEKKTYIPYSEVFLTNAYGANVAQTNRTTDYYQADENWWIMAKEKGIHIDDVAYDESAQAYSIDISSSIVSNDGTFLGVVKVVWNIEEIIDLMRITEVERREKKIFKSSTELTLLNTERDIIYATAPTARFFEKADDQLITIVEQAAETDSPYTLTSGNDNRARFITFANSTGFGNFIGLNWSLILEQKTDEIFAPIQSTQTVIGIILSIFILMTIALTVIYARHIQKIQALKDEFISVAAHELRAPLTNCKNSIEILKDFKLPKESEEWFKVIHQSNDQMIKLVEDLLNMSRLETGRLKISPQKKDITHETLEIIKSIEPLAKTKNQKIIIKTPQKGYKTMIDSSIYRLILSNLLTNAIKYSPSGENIVLTLKKNQDGYLLSIEDSGIGIPSEEQDKIFNKFFRANNAKISDTPGTGLGLFVIHEIVENLNGKLWFESNNKGTTFFLQLPQNGMGRT